MATVQELLGPEPTVDELLGAPASMPPVQLSPYETQRLQGNTQPMGPFGPAHPEEVLALPEILQTPAAMIEESGILPGIGEVSADFLRRTGIDPSAEAGKPTVKIDKVPLTVPGTDFSPLDAISPEFRKGIEQRAGELLSGLTEPGQAALLPLASLKPVLAAFALQAGSAIPGDVEAILNAKDPRAAGAALTSALANAAIATAGARGEATPADRVASRLTKAVRKTDLGDVELAAIRGGKPTVEQLLAPEAESAVQTSARPEKPTVPETPAEPYQTVLQEIRAQGPQTIRGIQELFPRAQLSDEQARTLRDQAWPGNADLRLTGLSAERQRQLEEIWRAGARTRREIQGLFPEAKLKSEEAKVLRDQAWPAEASPETQAPEPPAAAPQPESEHAEQNRTGTQPHGDVLNPEGPGEGPGQVPPVESSPGIPPRGQGETLSPSAQPAPQEDFRGVNPGQHIARISAMSPAEYFQYGGKGGKTREAYVLGRAIESPEQLQSLAEARDQAIAEQQAAVAKAEKSRTDADLQTMVNSAGKTQYFTEAYGAATGTGSAGEFLRQLDPAYQPPFPVEATTAIDPKAAPVAELPVAKIKLSADVPNFKAESDTQSGVVKGQELQGKYERLGTPPIVVWRRLNGDLEVITGRHRLGLARRSGEKSIPAQVVEEARGFTRAMALTFDAEANIRDGQGSVEDYAQYFKNSPQLSEAEARSRGLLARAKGAAGWDLGRNASDDVFSLWKAGKISEAQAVAIAQAAPGDPGLQQVGARGALTGAKPEILTNLIQAARLETGGQADQLDLLGQDDAAIQRMQDMAKRAAGAQRAIGEQIRAVQGAAKRPELARQMGVDVGDPQAVLARIDQLKADQVRWQNWPLHQDLVDQVKGPSELERAKPEPPAEPAPPAVAADFELGKPESVEEQQARLAAEQQTRQEATARQAVQAGAVAPLAGTAGDLGQGDLLSPNAGDLFSPPTPKTHAMAAGAPAAPLRRTVPRPAPVLPAPPTRLTTAAGAPRPVLGPLRAHLANLRAGFQSIFSPQNLDAGAKGFANLLRQHNAQAALDLVRAEDHIGDWRAFFDRTPVPKDYRYDPNQALPFNYAVMDAFERNRAALPAHLQDLARLFDAEFAWRVQAVQRIKPDAMQQLLANYFPHLWKNPDAKGTRAIMTEIAAKSPFHGSKAFLKQRSIPYFVEGLVRGLEPMSDNPVDLLLAKMHQMDKFLVAARVWEAQRASGELKYFPLGRKIPADRVIVDDPAFTVHAPPFLEVREAFDAGVRKGLVDFMRNMGFRYERVARLGINTWGLYTAGGKVQARFGAPDFVIMHEIGHGLEERYGLSHFLLANDTLRQEMSALAEQRSVGVHASKKFRQYAQTPDEQVANAVHAYIYAPDLMERIAPNAQIVMRNIIRSHPELAELNEIRPGVALKSEKMSLPTIGPQLAGHWTLPTGQAAVLTNYLSPGLNRWAPFRTLRAASNILNAAQLGFSGFHVGFTSLDATISSIATGLGYLLRGELGKAGRSFAFAPVAPVANYYVGKAVETKMRDPNATHVEIGFVRRPTTAPVVSIGTRINNLLADAGLGGRVRLSPAADALTRQVAELAVRGGLRATLDPFWKTHITRSLTRAWTAGGLANYGQATLQVPLAAVEQSMRPIAEYLVPRQKLGVFAQLALQEMERAGMNASPDQVRAAMARAADWTEDRMGQMTYDNLFYNKMVKDAALMGFRAYGWQLGKYRHLYGGVADTASLVRGLIENGIAAAKDQPAPRRLEVTNRMLYPVALTMVAGTVGAVLHRLFTGTNPQTLQDYFFPRTGEQDKDGRDGRLALPTYLKDVVGEAHALRTSVMERSPEPIASELSHKLNPWLGVTGDMWNNKDYYGVEIRHPDDPISKQMAELSQFALKQFTPFSVSGTLKLADDQAPVSQLVLPFVGIVPAKKALLMTPAETLAADITRNSTELGGRTRAQFDHARVLKTIAQDVRRNGTRSQVLDQAVAAGQLRPGDERALVSMLNTTPLEYQVGKMSPDDAMRVWRLGNAQERAQLQPQVARRVANSKVIADERRTAFLEELFGQSTPAPKVAPTPPKVAPGLAPAGVAPKVAPAGLSAP